MFSFVIFICFFLSLYEVKSGVQCAEKT